MAKIAMGKARPQDKPYLIYAGIDGWEYRVLKAYSADPHKPGARWFCAVKSPYTYGSYDLGDTYIADVLSWASTRVTFRDPEVPDEAIPDRTKVRRIGF